MNIWVNPFWFGFALGMITGILLLVAVAVAFGNKNKK